MKNKFRIPVISPSGKSIDYLEVPKDAKILYIDFGDNRDLADMKSFKTEFLGVSKP